MTISVRIFFYLLLTACTIILSGCNIDGSLQADREMIEKGQSSTLTWALSSIFGKAENAVIEPGIGAVPTEGSMDVSPLETTEYSITWTGEDGTATEVVTITVVDPPVVTLETDNEIIQTGNSAILSWTSENVTSCTIEPDIGNVDTNGSISVTPTETATYTITATGQLSTATATVTIEVNKLPEVTFSVDKSIIKNGESATLSWTSDNALTCSIEPDIGNVETNGSVAVSPDTDTTYTLTAVNGLGSRSVDVVVSVTLPLAKQETTFEYDDSGRIKTIHRMSN